MAQRTTRASRGEHTSAAIIQPSDPIQLSIFSAQKHIKVHSCFILWQVAHLQVGQEMEEGSREDWTIKDPKMDP
jgi:hypothetical protein